MQRMVKLTTFKKPWVLLIRAMPEFALVYITADLESTQLQQTQYDSLVHEAAATGRSRIFSAHYERIASTQQSSRPYFLP